MSRSAGRRGVGIGALVAFALIVSPAGAVISRHELRRAMRVADHVFPRACGALHPFILVENFGAPPLPGDPPEPSDPHRTAGALGWAMTAGDPCTIWLRPDWTYNWTGYELCLVIVHERGHLAGLQHSRRRASIMNAHGTPFYKPCERAFPRSLYAALSYTV